VGATGDRAALRAGYTAYLLESRGPLAGLAAVCVPQEGAPCDQLRLRPGVGYGLLPLPYADRVGFEVSAGPSVASPVGALDESWQMGAQADLATPIRLGKTERLWEQGPVSSYFLLIPRAGTEVLWPLDGAHPSPLTTFELTLNVRFVTWHITLP